MQKKKEIEMLIARYRTDIAALEKREEDLLRQSEILENMIPGVLVWYMGKATSRDKPIPQHEIEADVRGKLEHLKSVLREIQLVVGLLKEEKKIMSKRIEELETLLADQPESYSSKMVDIDKPVPKSEKPGVVDAKHKKELDNLNTEGFYDKIRKFEELSKVENTDWKRVSKDLQKQANDLTENLSNSSQKLTESKSYVKNLQEKNSNIKKELQAQIKMLEKRADSFIPEVEKCVVSPFDVSVIKDTRKNTKVVQTREIEILIVRYRADISALEKRKEDLMRHIEILENLIPSVLLWYMSKVFKTIEMPQQEIEKEAQDKCKHLEIVLGELQQAVEVITIEEKIMRKRIEELETFLTDQPHGNAGKIIDTDIPRPPKMGIMDLKYGKETGDLKTQGLEDRRMEFEELLQSENTDWKKVCQDLLKQISELSENLNKSSQQLKESEDFAKHLEAEYSILEKELKAKLLLLEKRTGTTISEAVDKKQEKRLEEELESKEETLAEVMSKQESLKKSTTLSQDTHIEPLVKDTDVYLEHESKEESPEPAEGQTDQIETADNAEGIVAPSEESVLKDAISENAESEILEGSDATADITEGIVAPTEVDSKEAIPDEGQVTESEKSVIIEPPQISPEARTPVEDLVVPTEVLLTEEASAEVAVAEGSVAESQLSSKTPTAEAVDTAEGIVVPTEAVLKDAVHEPDESKLPGSETSDVIETVQIPPEAGVTVENLVIPSEKLDSEEARPEEAKDGLPVSEAQVVPDIQPISDETVDKVELTVAQSGASDSKEAISERDEPEIVLSQTQQIPEVPEDSTKTVAIAEGVVAPTEEVSKGSIPEPDESHLPESETSDVLETVQIPPEAGVTVENLVIPSEKLDSEEARPEEAKDGLPVSEAQVVPDIQPISDETVDKVELTVAQSGASDSKEAISERDEPEIVLSQTQQIPEVPEDSTKTVAIAEGVVAPTEEVSKGSIPEPDESHLPESETSDVLETVQIPPEAGVTVENLVIPSEKLDSEEARPEEAKDGLPVSEAQVVPDIQPISDETVDKVELTVAQSGASDSKEAISERDEPEIVLSQTQQIPEVPEDSTKTVAIAEGVVAPTEEVSNGSIPEPDESHLPESETSDVLETTKLSPEAVDTAKSMAASSKAPLSKETISEPAERKSPVSQTSVISGIKQIPDIASEEKIFSPSKARDSKESDTMKKEAQMLLLEPSAEVAKADVPIIPPDISESRKSHLSPPDMPEGKKTEMLMKDSEPEGAMILDAPLSVEALTMKEITEKPSVVGKEMLPESSETKILSVPAEHPKTEVKSPMASPLEPLQQEILPPVTKTVVGEEKPSENLLPTKIAVAPTESVPLKSVTDGTGTQAIEPKPKDTPREISPRHDPFDIGFEKAQGLPTERASVASLATQTLQGKMRVKDHLIKTMADQLSELARNNAWAGSKALEAAMSTDPVKTYDWDRSILLLYLKGVEPQNYIATIKSNEDYSSSNPLNVKIVRKLDKDSLLIEWGPPPSAEVVGFQIFLNGQFKYWVHSANRNLALLHPLDLRLMLEIAVSPVNVRGDVAFRSTIVYKPE